MLPQDDQTRRSTWRQGGPLAELPLLLAGVVTSVARGRRQERLPLPEGAGRASTGRHLQDCLPLPGRATMETAEETATSASPRPNSALLSHEGTLEHLDDVPSAWAVAPEHHRPRLRRSDEVPPGAQRG